MNATVRPADVQAAIEWMTDCTKRLYRSERTLNYRDILAYIEQLERQQQWQPIDQNTPEEAIFGSKCFTNVMPYEVYAGRLKNLTTYEGEVSGAYIDFNGRGHEDLEWCNVWMPLPAVPQEVA